MLFHEILQLSEILVGSLAYFHLVLNKRWGAGTSCKKTCKLLEDKRLFAVEASGGDVWFSRATFTSRSSRRSGGSDKLENQRISCSSAFAAERLSKLPPSFFWPLIKAPSSRPRLHDACWQEHW